jgi:hypothetical protein
MFGLTVKTENKLKDVAKAADKANFRNIGHASASLAKDVRSTIKRAPKEQRVSGKTRGGQKVRRARHAASPVGTPPYTQRGQLSRAIVYAVADNKKSAVIGATANLVGQSASAHELGGSHKGQEYPKRPFMFPGLERAIPRLAGEWRGTIGA